MAINPGLSDETKRTLIDAFKKSLMHVMARYHGFSQTGTSIELRVAGVIPNLQENLLFQATVSPVDATPAALTEIKKKYRAFALDFQDAARTPVLFKDERGRDHVVDGSALADRYTSGGIDITFDPEDVLYGLKQYMCKANDHSLDRELQMIELTLEMIKSQSPGVGLN